MMFLHSELALNPVLVSRAVLFIGVLPNSKVVVGRKKLIAAIQGIKSKYMPLQG